MYDEVLLTFAITDATLYNVVLVLSYKVINHEKHHEFIIDFTVNWLS